MDDGFAIVCKRPMVGCTHFYRLSLFTPGVMSLRMELWRLLQHKFSTINIREVTILGTDGLCAPNMLPMEFVGKNGLGFELISTIDFSTKSLLEWLQREIFGSIAERL